MTGIEKGLHRKIATRRKALRSLGDDSLAERYGSIEEDLPDEDESPRSRKLAQHLRLARESWELSAHGAIRSERRVVGRAVVFLKKVVRRLIEKSLGWYIQPVIDRQSLENAHIVNTLSLLKEGHDEASATLSSLKADRLADDLARLRRQVRDLYARAGVACDPELVRDAAVDYAAFEDAFRGPRELVLAAQSVYVDLFREPAGEGVVLDLGSGRGEFLELLARNDIPAVGVESYAPFADASAARGHEVVRADALTYLLRVEDASLNGIFMAHVIEHVSTDYAVTLIRTALRKLKPGARFVLESPNPETLAVFATFYLDPGHAKPVPFQTLEFLFRGAGYASVERFENPVSFHPVRLAETTGDDGTALALNDLLYGNRDYTLIARKGATLED
jgi:SAM-dependent methyltransferase